MEPKFAIGNLVCLKSGGPTMTVTKIREKSAMTNTLLPFSGIIHTTWFEDNVVRRDTFHQDALEKDED